LSSPSSLPVKAARITAAFRLSGTTTCGTPPNQVKAAACSRCQVSMLWSKTRSAYM